MGLDQRPNFLKPHASRGQRDEDGGGGSKTWDMDFVSATSAILGIVPNWKRSFWIVN